MTETLKPFGLFLSQKRARRLARRQGKPVQKNPTMGPESWTDADKSEVARRIAFMAARRTAAVEARNNE